MVGYRQQIQQNTCQPIQFIKAKKISLKSRIEMGNISNKDQLSSLHENWITTTQPQSQLLPNINLYRSRLLINTITHDYIEEYMVHFISQDDYLHYLKQTGWRQGLQHREPMAYILPIRAFINTSTTQLCTNSHTACIYFDKVQMRLTDINDIPFHDALYMLRVCLQGFAMLKEHFGSFAIAEDMVFINEDGEVKVWIHANLSSVIPNREEKYFMSQKPAKKQVQTPSSKNQKAGNNRQLHEQSYNTQNSYQNPYRYPQPFGSQENVYAFPEISEQSMVNDILGIVEQNIDKETLGGNRLFSQFIKDRMRSMNSGNETARNKNPRVNVINSRYTDNGQGSQRAKARKMYTFPVILQLFKQFIQENNINLPRRMEVIHNIYQNKEEGTNHSSATANFQMKGHRNDSSSNSNSHSNNSNKNSLHNSQTMGKKISSNNANNLGAIERNVVRMESRYSSGEIVAPVGSMNVIKMNPADGWKQNNSLFEGKFDQSAVTHIGNKIQNKLSLDSRNAGSNSKYMGKSSNTPTPTNSNTISNTSNRNITNTPANNMAANSSNISYQNGSELNNSLNVVEVEGNLRYNLYSTSNVTTIFPINNSTTNNIPTGVAPNIRSLNNSRMNGISANTNTATTNIHIQDSTNTNNINNNNYNNNSNNNSGNVSLNTQMGNTIYNAIKIKNKNNPRTNTQNRRLVTEGSEYIGPRSVSKNANNMSSHPYVGESNTARSRNSSIEVTNKLVQPISQSYAYQQPQQVSVLNYNRLQNNTPTHSSQNSSLSSTNQNLNDVRNKISAVRVNPLSNNSSGVNMNSHINNPKKESEDKMIKYHSPLSTLLEEKYDHGSKIIRTTQNMYQPHANLNTKNGYYRHTSNQSTKIEPKLHSINSNSNINAIKYVKTPYVATAYAKELEQSSSPLVTKPSSVNIAKNTEYSTGNSPYVEKYIRDAHQPNGGVSVIQGNPIITSVAAYNTITTPIRQVYNNYQTLNQTPYSVHRNIVQQQTKTTTGNRQVVTKARQDKGGQKSQDKQVRYYTSNETYELDSEIALDLADVNEADI